MSSTNDGMVTIDGKETMKITTTTSVAATIDFSGTTLPLTLLLVVENYYQDGVGQILTNVLKPTVDGDETGVLSSLIPADAQKYVLVESNTDILVTE